MTKIPLDIQRKLNLLKHAEWTGAGFTDILLIELRPSQLRQLRLKKLE
jgi:hypothetical protein